MIIIKTKPNNTRKNNFKIIVSLKVSKKAVIRNKIRRRIKEILKQANLQPGFDITVITTQEIVNKGFGEIREKIINFLQNARAII